MFAVLPRQVPSVFLTISHCNKTKRRKDINNSYHKKNKFSGNILRVSRDEWYSLRKKTLVKEKAIKYPAG
jgi:hypothetical protein